MKGNLKIFLGYAAGVGKTYRMLQEARMLKEQGRDVVVGIVETHGRPETQRLIGDLEVLPRKTVNIEELEVTELDLDAALARKPDVILIDELAHTNAPGSRHQKRSQDVEELLRAGIDVYTTLNIQHIESLTDIVSQIAKITVAEIVPEQSVRVANEIEVVDIPVEDLLERLQQGKVYIPERAKQAAAHFFQEGNLLSLRELALRYATKHVGEDVQDYLDEHKLSGPWDASSRILVCVSASPSSEKLIQVAHRLAESLNVDWFAIHVDSVQQGSRSSLEQLGLEKNLSLARTLGAQLARVTGHSIAQEIIQFAQTKRITLLVIGHSQRTWWQRLTQGSLVQKIVSGVRPAQVLIVGDDEQEPAPQAQPVVRSGRYPWRSLTLSAAALLVTAIVCLFLRPYVDPFNLAILFLIPIVLDAIITDILPGIVIAVLAIGIFDFVFVPPYYTFSVGDLRFVATFAIMFFVAVVVNVLAGLLKRQIVSGRQRELFLTQLYSFSKDLLTSSSVSALLRQAAVDLAELFQGQALILLPDANGKLQAAHTSSRHLVANHDIGIAEWVMQNKQSAGLGTKTFAGRPWHYVPLLANGNPIGVLALTQNDQRFTNEEEQLLEAYVSMLSLVLTNRLDNLS